jgi:tRNA threonylcarbamoyl adenosine modification protein (Sua5/YciO/YrdC/YwlC family)
MPQSKLRTFYSQKPNLIFIEEAIEVLEQGGMIIFPTDTVYALGCLSSQGDRLKDLARIKGVKLEHAPLSFIFEDIRSLSSFVRPMNSQVFKLVKRLLPGPYTLIMEAVQKLPKPFQKRRTIGVRISDHPILKALLPLLSAPIVCTSIHDPDEIVDYTTDPEILLERWDLEIELMLSDGYGSNVPSTVIDLTKNPFEVLREGAGELPF